MSAPPPDSFEGPPPSRASSEGPRWAASRERGSALAITFLVSSLRLLGKRAPLQLLLAPITLYYCAFATTARRASFDYFSRIQRLAGASAPGPGWGTTYRHIHHFAEAILDRLRMRSAGFDDFHVEVHGRENMEPYIKSRSGAFLVGAHLGNFDVLRVIARDADIPVNVLMYTANAERINDALEALDPGAKVRVIQIDPRSIRAGFEIRRCVERGEFVAVLGDRMRAGSREPVCHARFLGGRAAFPQGPFRLAALLELPVVMTIAVKTGPRDYDIFLERLSDGGPLARSERAKAVTQQVERYASRLERYCLRYPMQWYNFYDFWSTGNDGHV